LYFARAHFYEFGCEQLYGVDLLEQLVQDLEKTFKEKETLEISCKIKQDKLYPARVGLGFKLRNFVQFSIVKAFLEKIESRVDVRLDYSLLNQFFSPNFDYKKLQDFWIGVDLRSELSESSVDIALTTNCPEQQKKAISLLNNKSLEKDVKMLLANNGLHIGFDLTLNGTSEIELYPHIGRKDCQQESFYRRLKATLSPLTIQLMSSIPSCNTIAVGLSKANSNRKIYYYLNDLGDFLNYFKVNEVAKKVHAYYQQQPTRQMCIALLEDEIKQSTIQNLNLYYYF
jgi:LynF/TruF/PatF family peptide O-prenyltransferase